MINESYNIARIINRDSVRYELWKEQREWLEKHYLKFQGEGFILSSLMKIANFFFGISKLKRIGQKNASTIKVKEISIGFPNLPRSFDGYKILHISDTHFDVYPDIVFAILSVLPKQIFDLVVYTGDYADSTKPNYFSLVKNLEIIKKNVTSIDGHIAVLGNHDTYRVVPELEHMGITALINESILIRRNFDTIQITGLDDVNSFYTSMAVGALNQRLTDFKILLVHSNEIIELAHAAGFQLYLCGHCHGGQICLPGGMPFITQSHASRKYFSGLWKYEEMIGYTSRGVGVVSIPYRFFSFPEITIYNLEAVAGIS